MSRFCLKTLIFYVKYYRLKINLFDKYANLKKILNDFFEDQSLLSIVIKYFIEFSDEVYLKVQN